MNYILKKIKWHFYYKKWRKLNLHNTTAPKNYFNQKLVNVGNYTYGELDVHHYGDENSLKIGNFCSIAPNVVFLLKDDHPLNFLSTFPFKVKALNYRCYEATSNGDIIVDDDVWIGWGAIILSGVHIEQGAVIAAGAVVTNDVPAYSVVGGCPARVIKYRFSEDIIKELLRIDYSKLSFNDIKEHIDLLYNDCNECVVQEIINAFPLKN